jgi:plastocyanin
MCADENDTSASDPVAKLLFLDAPGGSVPDHGFAPKEKQQLHHPALSVSREEDEPEAAPTALNTSRGLTGAAEDEDDERPADLSTVSAALESARGILEARHRARRSTRDYLAALDRLKSRWDVSGKAQVATAARNASRAYADGMEVIETSNGRRGSSASLSSVYSSISNGYPADSSQRSITDSQAESGDGDEEDPDAAAAESSDGNHEHDRDDALDGSSIASTTTATTIRTHAVADTFSSPMEEACTEYSTIVARTNRLPLAGNSPLDSGDFFLPATDAFDALLAETAEIVASEDSFNPNLYWKRSKTKSGVPGTSVFQVAQEATVGETALVAATETAIPAGPQELPQPTATTTVRLIGFLMQPAAVTVRCGEAIAFVPHSIPDSLPGSSSLLTSQTVRNYSLECIPRRSSTNATAIEPLFETDALSARPGGNPSFTYTFRTPGVFTVKDTVFSFITCDVIVLPKLDPMRTLQQERILSDIQTSSIAQKIASLSDPTSMISNTSARVFSDTSSQISFLSTSSHVVKKAKSSSKKKKGRSTPKIVGLRQPARARSFSSHTDLSQFEDAGTCDSSASDINNTSAMEGLAVLPDSDATEAVVDSGLPEALRESSETNMPESVEAWLTKRQAMQGFDAIAIVMAFQPAWAHALSSWLRTVLSDPNQTTSFFPGCVSSALSEIICRGQVHTIKSPMFSWHLDRNILGRAAPAWATDQLLVYAEFVLRTHPSEYKNSDSSAT